MAGIGFELRKILAANTISNTAAAYSIAGLISSGPWIISIFGILILGVLAHILSLENLLITQFQISVTYLIASSLIVSGFFQHGFTRFIADQLFLNKTFSVIPNFNGVNLVMTLLSGLVAFIVTLFFFPAQSILYHVLFTACFVVLCNIWVATNLLSGLKNYTLILLAFFLGYGLTVGLGYLLLNYTLEGLMFSFLIGQVVLLIIMHVALYKNFITNTFISFEFLQNKHIYYTLVFSSVFYNLGIWIDKFVFWYYPDTSHGVIGPLRGSILYDVPIFLAYLGILPGMAVFLLLVETDFADYYFRFYEAIRNGGTLKYIQVMREQMVNFARTAIKEIIKIQALTIVVVFLFGEQILRLLHVSTLYKNLLFIDIIGTSLQVIFLAILNILFYIDKRRECLVLCFIFVLLNLIFSIITLHLGPFYYGFGFTFSLVCVCIYGMALLNEEFEDLEYKTIMLH